jgi:hypothetical protein
MLAFCAVPTADNNNTKPIDYDQRRLSCFAYTVSATRRIYRFSTFHWDMHMKLTYSLLAAFILCATQPALAATPLWWSETMPHPDPGGATRHSHGGPVEIRRGVYYKNLWLRSGDGPANSSHVTSFNGAMPTLVSVTGEVQEIQGGNLHGTYGVNFAMPGEGFYNLYLVTETVSDGTRQVDIAKSEVLKHSCREGHDHVKGLMAPRHLDTIPLELVRERMDAESFHTTLGFGDTVTFQVLHFGNPVAGAEVTLHTAHGWRNTVRTDDTGHASFMMIRDYYPPWHEFERRYRQDYLVTAAYSVDGNGESAGVPYQSTRYLASLNGSYYPSPRDYRSYAYGLLLGVFALTVTAVSVYLYRRRRQRRFHEVRFDEKN